MATARIPEQLYRDLMLRGYSSAIQKNRKVVNANSTRFKLSLACLTVALILLFASGLALLPSGLYYDIGILLGGIILAFIVGRYIMGEHYLTIERE